MNTKGQVFLKRCGILLIIEGIVGIISYGLITLLLGAETIIEQSAGGAAVTGIAVMYLIAAIVALIAGVTGVKNNADKSAAGKCVVWGSINLLLTFVAGTWSASGVNGTFAHFIITSVGLIIPSLYIAGAYMNKE